MIYKNRLDLVDDQNYWHPLTIELNNYGLLAKLFN